MNKMNEENNQNDAAEAPAKKGGAFWDMVKYAILALIIVVPFRIFVAQPYVVSGSSMDPTFEDGDYLIVDQLSKRFEEPARQSVIIIRYPKNPSQFFIKRLIGFPGETVEIKNGKVTIYNENHKSGLTLEEDYIVYSKNDNMSVELGTDEYFVLGDNRSGSSDSRIWGTLPKKYIIGTPILRLLPLDEIGFWPGSVGSEDL